MANTVNFNCTLSLSATHATPNMSFSAAVPQVGSNYTEETQLISHTAATALDIGSIGTLGYLVVRNLDTANPVDVATDSGMTNKVATIAKGQGALIPTPSGVTIYLKATTADVQIAFLAIEL